MDFGELTLDGLVDTSALSSAITEADLDKIRLLAPQSIIKESPAPNFQLLVGNGKLENPKSTVELIYEVGDIEFHEIFIVMEKIIGLSFLQRNNTILDMRHGHGSFIFPIFLLEIPKLPGNQSSEIQEESSTLLGTSKLLPKLHSKTQKTLTPFFKLLTKDEKVLVTPDLLEKLTKITRLLIEAAN